MASKTNFRAFIQLMIRGFGSYWKSIALMVGIGFIGGLFESIGVNAIVPLFSFLTNPTASGVTEDTITKAIHGLFTAVGVTFSLKNLLVLIVVLFVFRAMALLVATLVKIRITTDYECETRESLLKTFLHSRWSYLLKERLGHLETIVMTNVRNSSLVLEHFSAMVIICANLVIYLLVAVSISFQITLFTLMTGFVLFFLFKPLLGSTRKFSQEIETSNKNIAHFLNENILGLKTVKTMSVAPAIEGIGKSYFSDLRARTVRIATLRSLGDVFIQPIGVLFICVVFIFSYKATNFQIGTFAAVIYLIQRIFIYFQQFQGSLRMIIEYSPFLQTILSAQAEARHQEEEDAGVLPFSFQNELRFQHVGFGYGSRASVLGDCDFTVKKGQVIGLIGPSGAGKTTIVDLILRLFSPQSGQILLDGKDIAATNLKSWRRSIGYVSQDIFLINDTLEKNITFYDPSVTKEEMILAAKKANIHEFIMSLPEGYRTHIGERGTLLSGGQRQRVIIARVLARRPQLLILDEATSALDNESERQIQAVIEGLRGEITVLIIAHRLSTVMGADKIMAVSEGRIIEDGKPNELLARPDSYLHRVYHQA
jgi:ABC-type multidrug transport system fused ATPase/permease subunit